MCAACRPDHLARSIWKRLALTLATLCCACVAAEAAQPAAHESLAILPAAIVLHGPKARQALIVEKSDNGQFGGQAAKDVSFESSDAKVVRISNSVAIPVSDGHAVISAVWHGHKAAVAVTVEQHSVDAPWSFRNHVQSVLTKAGCNSGACHGAAAGKNGFRLSLWGCDPEADFLMITRQSHGRRIVPSDPGRSLFLLKPTGAVPHKGVVRFAVDSREYRVLAEWIAAGQPAPTADDPRIERLQVLPEHVVLKKGESQQYSVIAHFSDG